MYRSSLQPLNAFLLAASLSLRMAAAPAVGIVTAETSFKLDDSRVTGSATLFEGARVETGAASLRLQLNNGARMQLSAESKGVVYQDRLVLERGAGRFERYSVEALSLRVQPEGADTSAEVSVRQASLAGAGLVQVSALKGAVHVTRANGVLLANMEAGRTLSFAPDDTPAAATTVTGCVENAEDRFFLTDETSLVRFQIIGQGLAKELGHRVRIAGSVTSLPDSMSLIQSASVKVLSKKCSNRATKAAAAGVGAAGIKAAGTKAAGSGTAGSGASTAAAGAAIGTKAIVVGVVVAGAAAGAAVAVVKENNADEPVSISPSSR